MVSLFKSKIAKSIRKYVQKQCVILLIQKQSTNENQNVCSLGHRKFRFYKSKNSNIEKYL